MGPIRENEGTKSDISESTFRPDGARWRSNQILAVMAVPLWALLHRARDCLSAVSQH